MGANEYLAKPWLKHYPPGVPATVEAPLRSVGQAFDEATERDPQRAAVVFYGRSITYRELREATDRLASALAALGITKGDRIALYLLNSPQFIIAYFAALKCGAAVTPISPVYTSHEVRYQLQDSGARAVICQDILYERWEVRRGARLRRAHQRRRVPAGAEAPVRQEARVRPAANLHWLQDLLKKYPAQPPAVDDRPARRPRRAALHRRHDRQPEGRDAHALQPGGRAGDGRGGVLRRVAGQGGDPRLPAVFPHLRPGGHHAERPVPGEAAGAVHQSRHRGDPRRDGALPGHRVLRRADALRVPEGPQGHQQGELAPAEAACCRAPTRCTNRP